jgi:hypothetical protein
MSSPSCWVASLCWLLSESQQWREWTKGYQYLLEVRLKVKATGVPMGHCK